jgi:hypothetical protein
MSFEIEHARHTRLVVVGRNVLLEMAGEHDLGQRRVGPGDPRLDHRGLLLGKRRRLDDDPNTHRLPGLRRFRAPPPGALAAHEIGESLALPRRNEESERRLLAVGTVFLGDARPGDLVGVLREGIQARGRPGEDPGGSAFPDGLLRDGSQTPEGEDDLALHVLAGVIGGLLSGAHVQELGRDVGRAREIRDRGLGLGVGAQARLPRRGAVARDQPRLGADRRPRGGLGDLVDPAHVRETDGARPLLDVVRNGEEALGSGRLVPLRRDALGLEGDVARDLVGEKAFDLRVDEGGGLGENRGRQEAAAEDENPGLHVVSVFGAGLYPSVSGE